MFNFRTGKKGMPRGARIKCREEIKKLSPSSAATTGITMTSAATIKITKTTTVTIDQTWQSREKIVEYRPNTASSKNSDATTFATTNIAVAVNLDESTGSSMLNKSRLNSAAGASQMTVALKKRSQLLSSSSRSLSEDQSTTSSFYFDSNHLFGGFFLIIILIPFGNLVYICKTQKVYLCSC